MHDLSWYTGALPVEKDQLSFRKLLQLSRRSDLRRCSAGALRPSLEPRCLMHSVLDQNQEPRKADPHTAI